MNITIKLTAIRVFSFGFVLALLTMAGIDQFNKQKVEWQKKGEAAAETRILLAISECSQGIDSNQKRSDGSFFGTIITSTGRPIYAELICTRLGDKYSSHKVFARINGENLRKLSHKK